MTLIEGMVLTVKLQNVIGPEKALDLARNRCLSDYCGFMIGFLRKPEDWELPKIMGNRIVQLAEKYKLTPAPPASSDSHPVDAGG